MFGKPLTASLFALGLVLCLAYPGLAEQSRPGQATTRAIDDAAARKKSAENLKRIVSNAVGFATETDDIRLPKTLHELQASEWRIPPETFLNPRTGSTLPDDIGETRKEQAEWVEKNSDYVWGGNGRKMIEVYGDSLIAWEKPDGLREGINIAFADATVRFVKLAEAKEMIRRGRASGG